MYRLFLIFDFLKQPPLWPFFFYFLVKKTQRHFLVYIGGAFPLFQKIQYPASMCSVQLHTKQKLNLQSQMLLSRSCSERGHPPNLWLAFFFYKRQKHLSRRCYVTSIQAFSLNATRQLQVGDFELMWTRYILMLGWFAMV